MFMPAGQAATCPRSRRAAGPSGWAAGTLPCARCAGAFHAPAKPRFVSLVSCCTAKEPAAPVISDDRA